MLKTILFRKTLDQLGAEAASQQGFRRTLGTLQLTLLGIGLVIGTGIFVLTGHIAAANAGPAVCLSFMLAALPAALAAFCYAEMVSLIPAAGGAYTYVSASLGEMPGFLIGWTLTLAYLVGTATVATGWSAYAHGLMTQCLGHPLPMRWIDAPMMVDATTHAFHWSGAVMDVPALFIVLLMSAVTVLGARESMGFTVKLVVVKLSVVVAFLIAASQVVDTANWTPFLPANSGTFGHFGWSGVLQGGSIAVFAYLGVDNLSTAVQEAKEPQRSMPRAIAITMVCCTILYVAVCLVLTGAVPYKQLGVPDPISVGVAATHRTWLEVVVQLGTLAGLTSVLMMQLYGLPRILFAMAHDGLAPKWAGNLDSKHATPQTTTVVMGVICATGAALLPIQVLSELTSAGVLLTFACVSGGVVALRHRYPTVKRKFRVPFGPYLLPGLSAAMSLILLVVTPVRVLSMLACWLVVGMMGYAVAVKHRRRAALTTANVVQGPPASQVPS